MNNKLVFKTFILFLLLSGTRLCYAQFSGCGYTEKDYTQFKKTTTLFVLEKYPGFEEALKKAVAKDWTLTKYEFITPAEVPNYIGNPNYSLCLEIEKELLGPNNNSSFVRYYALICGGKKHSGKYGEDDMLAYTFVNTFGHTTYDYVYRIPNLISELQQAYTLVGELKIKGNSSAVRKELIDFYQKKADLIATKKLLVDSTCLKNIDDADISKAYTYPFKRVGWEEIPVAIKAKNNAVVYLVPVFSAKFVSIFVIDPVSGSVLYADFELFDDYVRKSDFKNIASAIEKASRKR